MTTTLSPPRTTAPPVSSPHRLPSRADRPRQTVRWLSIGYLSLMFGLMLVLYEVSERWWLGSAVTYLPRVFLLVPPVVLTGVAVKFARRMVWVNLCSLLVVLFPILGMQMPWATWFGGEASSDRLRVVSCNVQNFSPDFGTVLAEITECQPDLIALQEAPEIPEALRKVYPEWSIVHEEEYVLAARYPLTIVGRHRSEDFDRVSAIAVRMQTPTGPVHVVNLHTMTARHSLTELDTRSIANGEGGELVETYAAFREHEMMEVRAFVADLDPKVPTIILGDFNTPTVSSLYRDVWSDYANAFDQAGLGFGYTSPAAEHRVWPTNTPWLRIDHILASDHFTTTAANIGEGMGSDHRAMFAEFAPSR